MLGVTFETKHSFDDFGLILSSTEIGSPEPKRYLLEAMGRNGLIDLTDVITPTLRYGTRQISYTFQTIGKTNWQEKMRLVGSYLHGKRLHVTEDSDPDWYWDGIVNIASQSSSEAVGEITIVVEAEPFKRKVAETTYSITGDGELTCVNSRMEVHPTIVCTEEATIVFGTKTITLSAGTHLVAEFEFTEGDNELTIASEGTTTIKYREGAL